MKFPTLLKKVSILEGVLFAAFLLYLILPIQTPLFLAPYIDTPLGILILFCITVYLFFYMNPLLGIIYIFVAYEVIRRASSHMGIGNEGVRTSLIMQYSPTEAVKQEVMVELNPHASDILEEQIVAKMAPIGVSEPNPIVNSVFSPVAENTHGASMV
jgi:hypothetical protein